MSTKIVTNVWPHREGMKNAWKQNSCIDIIFAEKNATL
jgi:hypothetical protein